MSSHQDQKSKQIRIGSRESRLALVQVEEVRALLKKAGRELLFEHILFKTQGDKDKKTSLTTNPADDFFTDTLDQALLNQEIDIAIHSAKDLPKVLRPGLDIFALTAGVDATDAYVGKISFFDLKSGAKVGTSSVLRQQMIKELNPQVEAIDVRGTIEERLALVEKGFCDGVVVATAALKRLGLADRIKDIFPWESSPLQGQLAIVGREKDSEFKELFSAIDVRSRYGTVTLVGAGPGDPELITLKGIKTLQHAECVFYDYLVHPDILLYAGKAEKIYVGKRKGEHTLDQKELSKMLRQKAMEGKNVVRLKGGDPLIFGRGADEIGYLAGYHIKVRIIPGISSATGIPSSLGIPLTARGISSSVAFLSGHSDGQSGAEDQLINIPAVDTAVFLMGLTKLKQIVCSLKNAGWSGQKPMMVISKGTRCDEDIVCGTIDTIENLVAQHAVEPPALIIVSDTIKFWQRYLSKPQAKVLYLGTNPEKYRSLGSIIHFPMIEIIPQEFSAQQLKQLLLELPQYALILLTSRFSVHHFMRLVAQQDTTLDVLKSIDFAVVGEDTRFALEVYGIKPKVIATDETSEGLFQAITSHYEMKGKKILFPRSALPNPFLREELSKKGALVKELVVYDNRKPTKRALPPAAMISKVIFTSPSTVKNFLEDYGTIPSSWEVISKGPHTKKALEDNGYKSTTVIYA